MPNYETLDELKSIVNESDNYGIVHTLMQQLRDAVGAKKLGVHVRRAISDELAGLGLGHLPAELPENQGDEVLIYKLGSKTAKVIGAVQHPSTQAADVIREVVADGAKEKLDEIRAVLE